MKHVVLALELKVNRAAGNSRYRRNVRNLGIKKTFAGKDGRCRAKYCCPFVALSAALRGGISWNPGHFFQAPNLSFSALLTGGYE